MDFLQVDSHFKNAVGPSIAGSAGVIFLGSPLGSALGDRKVSYSPNWYPIPIPYLRGVGYLSL